MSINQAQVIVQLNPCSKSFFASSFCPRFWWANARFGKDQRVVIVQRDALVEIGDRKLTLPSINNAGRV